MPRRAVLRLRSNMSKGFDRIPESFAGATRTRKRHSPQVHRAISGGTGAANAAVVSRPSRRGRKRFYRLNFKPG
jgi:hypothetical protein